MKKITNQTQKRLGAICLAFLMSSSMLFAVQQYCHKAITATDGVTNVYLTCQLVSSGNYQIKIESDVAMAGLGGSFCNVNGVGGYQLNADGHFVLSGDGKTITCDIASTSGPNLYTPLYVLMPGEKVFTWPGDVDWTASCSGGGTTDTAAPTAFTVAKGAVGPTSVELLLNATDDSGSVTYSITYGSTTLTTTGTSGVQKSYIVTGLSASTAYSFAVTAKDAANNVASNNPQTVNATTSAAPVLSTIDFETVGQDWTWMLFENGDNAPALYSVVANPASNAVNSSANCAKYIVNANGQPWAGLWSDNLVDFTFNASNCIVKVKVYKSVISNFDVKFEGANGLNFEKLVANTKINEWEELTFDFTNRIGSTVSRLVIIPDFPSTRTAGSTNYWDNISFNSNTTTSNADLKADNISCYPNPMRNELTVSAKSEISQVIVRNLVGQTVKTIMINGLEKTIDMNGISAGNYLVTMKLANGQVLTQKVTKF